MIYLVFKYAPNFSFRSKELEADGWTFTGLYDNDSDQPLYVKAFDNKEAADAVIEYSYQKTIEVPELH